MSKSVITDSLLKGIADAIRAKTGGAGTMTPAEMAAEIEAIPAGGGATEPYIEYEANSKVNGVKLHGFDVIPEFLFASFGALSALDLVGCHITEICQEAFRGAGNTTVGKRITFAIPDTVTRIYTSAFKDCKFFFDGGLPAGLTYLGDGAFSGSLISIDHIPEGITAVNNYVFENCTNLASMYLHDGVESIGESAFAGCKNLKTITLPAGLSSIGAQAFRGTGLESFPFPAALVSVPANMLSANTGITALTVPATVSAISAQAFAQMTALESVDIMGAASIGSYCFYRCVKLAVVRLHGQCTFSGAAFPNCTALTDIYVPWSLGDVAGAPWGATNATIHYDTVFDANGDPIE